LDVDGGNIFADAWNWIVGAAKDVWNWLNGVGEDFLEWAGGDFWNWVNNHWDPNNLNPNLFGNF
jgi:hypothetical protein